MNLSFQTFNENLPGAFIVDLFKPLEFLIKKSAPGQNANQWPNRTKLRPLYRDETSFQRYSRATLYRFEENSRRISKRTVFFFYHHLGRARYSKMARRCSNRSRKIARDARLWSGRVIRRASSIDPPASLIYHRSITLFTRSFIALTPARAIDRGKNVANNETSNRDRVAWWNSGWNAAISQFTEMFSLLSVQRYFHWFSIE